MAVCVNCHILLRPSMQIHEYFVTDLSSELVSVTEEWCGREVSNSDRLCEECVRLVIREGANHAEDLDYQQRRQIGHKCVCICCGISLMRRHKRRRHRLLPRSEERTYIENNIFPQQVPEEAWTCHPCWMKAYENRPVRPEAPVEPLFDVMGHSGPQQAEIDSSVPPSPELPASESEYWAGAVIPNPQLHQVDIALTNYRRTSDTPNRCFVPNCDNEERHRVPRYLKRAILKNKKIFVTDNARVCVTHSAVYNWEMLNDHGGFINSFNATQINSMLELLSSVD